MNKYQIITGLMIVLTSCTPTSTTAPPLPITTSDSSIPIPATPVPQEVAPTPAPGTVIESSPTVESALAGTETLWFQILSPQDEAIVSTPQVDVIGSAPSGAIVSINDEILIVGSDQQFKARVTLDEGPNLIEIIASNEAGDESSLMLTITYEP